MPQSAASRRDTDGRCCRDRAAADAEAAERLRSVRERLEAAVSGLGELDYLRQRQEVLVRAALELREQEEDEEPRREARLSSEEKLLEENILLLRKQLTCLRRRDAGLLSQLQELDRQISDLRLDTEASHDPLETDSRPSSGFYELSDGASVCLSNSSNSIFSECFCSMADADGRLPPADKLAGCLECDGLVGGLCDEASATVRRSLSAPQPPTLDPVPSSAPCDSKYHCDLLALHGGDTYRYPSPLHAVAVQSPPFLHMLGQGGHGRDEGVLKSVEGGIDGLKPDSSLPAIIPQSSSWPTSSQTPSHKHLDSYIYSLLQRRALPIRTSRPRTSINTDPSKSILRQASLCVRQVSGPSSGSALGTLRASEVRPSWAAGGASAAGSSPLRLRPVDCKSEDQEGQSVSDDCVNVMQQGLNVNNADFLPNHNAPPLTDDVHCGYALSNKDVQTNSLLKRSRRPFPPSALSTATEDFKELGSPKANSSPKETTQPCNPPEQEQLLKSTAVVKTQSAAPRSSTQPVPLLQPEQEIISMGSSSQSHDEAGGQAGCSHMVNAKYVPTQRQNLKIHKGGGKHVKTVRVKTTTTTKTRTSEHDPDRRGDKCRHRSGSKKSRHLGDGGSIHIKVSRRAADGGGGMSSSRIKRLPVSIPEGQVLERHTSTLSSVRLGASRCYHHGNLHHTNGNHHRHHHHGHDQVAVVAKPKHKRNDYPRLRAIMEAPYDEAFRRGQRRRRKELLSNSAANEYSPSDSQLRSPYSYVAGSDSEYSAECASLFHSTIMDTSEDERSNYTTNCFGDTESSEEYVEESATTSDTEESGGGGAGGGIGGTDRGWSQLGPAGSRGTGQEISPTQAKTFVKIKASHNLKKKILRFRSGSLKLMTTV